MHRIPILLLCAALAAAIPPAHAAKAEKNAKPERAAKAERKAAQTTSTNDLSRLFARDAIKRDARYGLPDGLAPAVALKGGEPADQVRKDYAAAVAAALPNLGTDNVNALLFFEANVHHAARPGAEPERATCVDALLAALQSDLSPTAKVELVRQLATVGRAESVPALVALMQGADPWLAETARRALQNNPAPDAAAALRDALAKAADPAAKAAYALAIAGRGDTAGVPAIAKLLAGQDATLAVVACDALGILGGDEAARALVAARPALAGPAREAAALALVRIADARLRDGRTSEATELLKPLATPDESREVRIAARRGLLAARGDAAAGSVLEMLAGNDADAKIVALGAIASLAPDGRKALVAGLDRLPAPERALVLESVARLGEKTALPAALRCIGETDAGLRDAGLAALAALGDATTVPVLCAALGRTQDAAERAALEQALIALPGGEATDLALAAGLKGDPAAAAGIPAVLVKRGARAALPALAAVADGADPKSSRDAFKALAQLGTAADADAYIARLVAVKMPEVRGEAENAARRALSMIGDAGARSAIVRDALGAATDRDVRMSLLRLLPDAGDGAALKALTAATGDTDARVRDAAVRALANWPDMRAWDAIAAVYTKPEKDAHRAAALNGMARLVRAAAAKPDAKLIARAGLMLDSAKTDDEVRLALGALGSIGDAAAIDLAKPLLERPAVKAEAALAIKAIATLLKKSNPDAAKAAFKLVK